jgi:secreted trypsin-like serine protease
MMFDNQLQRYIQLGVVSGGLTVNQCGQANYPAIFTRLNHPEILDFILSVIKRGSQNFFAEGATI